MFGYVVASTDELSEAGKRRYQAVYCGICRRIRHQSSQIARLTLRYDCAFLALLHISLYEPEEALSQKRCPAHPFESRSYLDCDAIRYAADINVALAYYKALDDWHDDKSLAGRALCAALEKSNDQIAQRYPRQCQAIRDCIQSLSRLEAEKSADIDRCAACFGALMAELMVFREDHWAPTLRALGGALGRFVYLADAACDFSRDEKRHRYNPYAAAGCRDKQLWKTHLTMAMGACCDAYERLPLVQDKDILDNILYSGVWTRLEVFGKEDPHEGSL